MLMTYVVKGSSAFLFTGVCKMFENLWKHITKTYAQQICLGLAALPIGVIVGMIDAVFGQTLLKITAFRQLYPLYLIPFLPLAGVLIVYCYQGFGKNSSKGMNLIFEVGHGDEEVIPMRLIPFVISGTWITHLFGGSAGREGVAVQIGATFSHWVGRHIPMKNAPKIFLVAGMAAGFAGLFQTPIAAVLFALEVLVASEIRYDALFPALIASFAASMTSGWMGLEKFTFALSDTMTLDPVMMIKLLAAGAVFGIVGGAFAWSLKKAKEIFAARFVNPLIRIAVIAICLSILFILLDQGRYSGLGTNLIDFSFHGGMIYSWDWILKFALTVITLAAGFQGGEVTPLFSIGASLGVVIASFFHLPVAFMAALGYAAVFGGATNTFFAPMLIGAEVFGFAYLPYFFVVCAAAYVFNMNKSIYSLQKVKKLHDDDNE